MLCYSYSNFNPRPPCGGQPFDKGYNPQPWVFQSTSSVWRTTELESEWDSADGISIHVLRVEDNSTGIILLCGCCDFNPRPPCGGQHTDFFGYSLMSNFNPRPPCGGQRTGIILLCGCCDFNPRPPCGGQRCWSIRSRRITNEFQSTSSVWRTTSKLFLILPALNKFQSTSSVWRTTVWAATRGMTLDISIHVLRVEDNSKNREKSLFAFI